MCLLGVQVAHAATFEMNGFGDGGWVGEKSGWYCTTGCTVPSNIYWEARRPSETYAQTGVSGVLGVFEGISRPPLLRFVDGGVFLHVAPRYFDGGTGTFDPEFFAQIDLQCDGTPTPPSVGVASDGTLTLSTSTVLDRGAGMANYGFSITDPVRRDGYATIAVSATSSTQSSFGPGSWLACADGNDAVGNYCGQLPCSAFTVAPSALMAPPPPTPTTARCNDNILTLDVATQALHWHAMTMLRDGGTFAGPYSSIDAPNTQMRAYFVQCEPGMRVRVAAYTDAGITPWSSWSVPFTVDPYPPRAVTGLTVQRTTGPLFDITWNVSTDDCTSVDHYEVHSFTPWGSENTQTTPSPIAQGVVSGAGVYRVDVYAVDTCGNLSAVTSTTLTEAPVDAGVDAGMVDAGVDAGLPDAGDIDAGQPDAAVDAGTPDASTDAGPDASVDAGPDASVDAGPDASIDAGIDGGIDGGVMMVDAGMSTQVLVVNCDCQSSSGLGVWLAVVLLLRRRRVH